MCYSRDMTTNYCNELIGSEIPATYTAPSNYAYGIAGKTFLVVGAFEVGPGMAGLGWTHMLALVPVNGKVERYAAVTIVDGEITQAQEPRTMAGTR